MKQNTKETLRLVGSITIMMAITLALSVLLAKGCTPKEHERIPDAAWVKADKINSIKR